jgi:hypothetical protein
MARRAASSTSVAIASSERISERCCYPNIVASKVVKYDRNMLLTRRRTVERQIEFKYIDAGLAEETDQAVAGVFGDKLAELIFR